MVIDLNQIPNCPSLRDPEVEGDVSKDKILKIAFRINTTIKIKIGQQKEETKVDTLN